MTKSLYSRLRDFKAKRAARKADEAIRFSELERENRKRIEALQQNTPFCSTSDWQGTGCPIIPHPNVLQTGNTDHMRQHGAGDEEMQIATPHQPHAHRNGERHAMSEEDTSVTTSTTGNAPINTQPNETQPRDEELVIPDVSHITPPQYEDVRMRTGGGPCKKTRKERVLRKKVQCGDREVVR
ncbi:MAG: hypothetical protein LQ337_001755 [Flavoplaca oasis]|nr:MAG: hypothetical protein LQ337_001755 [Flavoplaca oasis]